MVNIQDVGGLNPSEKYESQLEGLSHRLWNIKKCLKPPTSKQISVLLSWNFLHRWSIPSPKYSPYNSLITSWVCLKMLG